MWFLLMILLFPLPSRVIILNVYSNSMTCQQERDRVGFEMAEAYPFERDFIIVCSQRYEALP